MRLFSFYRIDGKVVGQFEASINGTVMLNDDKKVERIIDDNGNDIIDQALTAEIEKAVTDSIFSDLFQAQQ